MAVEGAKTCPSEEATASSERGDLAIRRGQEEWCRIQASKRVYPRIRFQTAAHSGDNNVDKGHSSFQQQRFLRLRQTIQPQKMTLVSRMVRIKKMNRSTYPFKRVQDSTLNLRPLRWQSSEVRGEPYNVGDSVCVKRRRTNCTNAGGQQQTRLEIGLIVSTSMSRTGEGQVGN